MKALEYKKFIVVDEDDRPMAFDGDQLCFCHTEDWQDDAWPVRIYSKETARRYIKKSIEFRKKNGFSDGQYKLMPVK